jgi:hypothetical protein
MATPPPPGVYVPAVLFMKENEDLDDEAIKAHVLRLAEVLPLRLAHIMQPVFTGAFYTLGGRDGHPRPGLQRRGAAPLARRAEVCDPPHARDTRCARLPSHARHRGHRRAEHARDEEALRGRQGGRREPRARPHAVDVGPGDDEGECAAVPSRSSYPSSSELTPPSQPADIFVRRAGPRSRTRRRSRRWCTTSRSSPQARTSTRT